MFDARRFRYATNVAALYAAAAGGNEAETDTLVAAMSSTPDATRIGHINTLIAALKAAGVWSKLDVLWVLAAHDAQAARLNWKTPASFALTAVNSPTFTTDRGYAGDGASSYLNTGWTPSTNAVQFTLNSGSLGFYINDGTDAAEASPVQFGSIGGNGSFLRARGLGDLFQGRMNQATSDTLATVASNRGFQAIDRASSSSVTGYKLGASVGTSSTSSGSLPTQPFYIGALNNGGSAANFATQRIAMTFAGGTMSSGEHAAFDTALDTYLAAVGGA